MPKRHCSGNSAFRAISNERRLSDSGRMSPLVTNSTAGVRAEAEPSFPTSTCNLPKVQDGGIIAFSAEFMDILIRDKQEEESRVLSATAPYLKPAVPLQLRGQPEIIQDPTNVSDRYYWMRMR